MNKSVDKSHRKDSEMEEENKHDKRVSKNEGKGVFDKKKNQEEEEKKVEEDCSDSESKSDHRVNKKIPEKEECLGRG